MDFRQSNQSSGRQSAPAPSAQAAPPITDPTAPRNSKKASGPEVVNAQWLRIMNFIVLVGIAVLVAGIAFAFTRSNPGNESKYVKSSNYQAVFLNNGQVYFGKIANINAQSVELQDIYYLTQSASSTTATSTANSNYTLVKLGCQQIHDPLDQMVINRDQVTFWENISDDGQVVKNINSFKKQYPKGPDCTQVSNQTQASDTSSTQGGASSTTQGASTTKP
jgi:hypothetical protein